MRVLHICTYDQGGAANAALCLHEGLIEAGVHSVFASKWINRDGRNRIAVARGKTDWRANLYPTIDYYLARAAHPRSKNIVTMGRLRGVGMRAVASVKPDLIHLHWIDHGMLSIPDLENLANSRIPIVWTLHDMAPAAGGFGFRESVGLPPDPLGPLTCQDERKIRSESILRRRTLALANANLTVVSPSGWLAEEARHSPVFANHRIKTIESSCLARILLMTNAKACSISPGRLPGWTIAVPDGA
jgi:hypothetical protein